MASERISNEYGQIEPLAVATMDDVSFIENIYHAVNKLENFVVTNCVFDGEPTVIIHNKQLHYHPPFGMTS